MTEIEPQKAYWDLAESTLWICTRDLEQVRALSILDEQDRIALAMFGLKPPVFRIGPPESVNGANIMWPGQALDELLRKVHSRRVGITAMRAGDNNEQIPVPAAELNELTFFVQPDYGPPLVGLYSRSRDRLLWRSPQFWRADIVRAWPARNTKTVAVAGAILCYLQTIMSPGAALSKPEARERCLAEVPNAYPAAFEEGWRRLNPALKRKRGQHGPRAH